MLCSQKALVGSSYQTAIRPAHICSASFHPCRGSLTSLLPGTPFGSGSRGLFLWLSGRCPQRCWPLSPPGHPPPRLFGWTPTEAPVLWRQDAPGTNPGPTVGCCPSRLPSLRIGFLIQSAATTLHSRGFRRMMVIMLVKGLAYFEPSKRETIMLFYNHSFL